MYEQRLFVAVFNTSWAVRPIDGLFSANRRVRSRRYRSGTVRGAMGTKVDVDRKRWCHAQRGRRRSNAGRYLSHRTLFATKSQEVARTCSKRQ